MRTIRILTGRLRPVAIAGTLAFALLTTACSPAGTPEEHVQNIFGDLAGQAGAIIQCESKWDPGAVSATNDHGLFQINQVHRDAFSQVTGQPWAAIYDPYWNTVYAKHLHDRQGWQPWACRRVL